MEFLEQKKTAQPQEKDPKDDLLDHWRTQAATIEPKPRQRRRWLAERRPATAKTTARQEASKITPTESEGRDQKSSKTSKPPSRKFAEWSEWDERPEYYGAAGMEGSEPDWRSDESRSESARAANEFQIATDLKR